MRRREFLGVLGSSTVVWTLAVHAQQTMPVIGFIGGQTPDLFESRLRAFRQGLSKTGHMEGRNVMVEYRWAQGRDERLPALAADLVRRQVAVIVTSSTSSVVAAKAATKTIPIVFSVSSDPVQLGLVENLNRPGGNITGSTNLGVEAGPKVMAFLIHPANPGTESQINEQQTAARILGLQLHVLRASTEGDIDAAFAALSQLGIEALVIGPDNFFNTRSEQLATLALRYRVPVVYNDQPFVAAGGLMSYGASIADQYRIAGLYAGRILKGEKPADLPVQQSTKVELFLNLKTARAFGLNVPATILGRADEVIE